MPEKSNFDPDSTIHRFFGSSWWVPFLITGVPLLIFAGGLWTLSEPHHGCNQVNADILSIHNALDMYRSTSGSFPTNEQGLKALMKRPTSAPVPSQWIQIMKRDSLDPWKRPYAYRFPGPKDPRKPEVYSVGVDGIEGTDDDIHLDDN